MDLEKWLETTDIPFAESAWKNAPSYPYGVYDDDKEVRGADEKLMIADHEVTIELYSDIKSSLAEAKASLEALFCDKGQAFEYLGTNWIESERHFQSTYTISYTEKLKKEK